MVLSFRCLVVWIAEIAGIADIAGIEAVDRKTVVSGFVVSLFSGLDSRNRNCYSYDRTTA